MEIRYKLYPYPVLAYYSDDYKNGSFESVVDLSLNGYHVQVDFTVALNNEDLKNLIAQGKAQYVYHLECPQTGFRTVKETSKIFDSYIINNKAVCGKLQICPFIVAKDDISAYTNSDFHNDYSAITFDIEKGCILAVGKQVNVNIEKITEDFASTPSIFSIVCNANVTVSEMLIDYHSNQKIIIKLPQKDYYNYKQLSKAPETQTILNAITIIPALSYILSEISKLDISDREELQEYGWYRTIKNKLHKIFSCDIEDKDFNQQNTFSLAQKLINNPASDALNILCTGFVNTGGVEE